MGDNQAKILVKKADGTSTEMTWEEFRKYQEEQLRKIDTTETQETTEIGETDDLGADTAEANDELVDLSPEDKEIWDELEKEIEKRAERFEVAGIATVQEKEREAKVRPLPKETAVSIKKELPAKLTEDEKEADQMAVPKQKIPELVTKSSALSNAAPVKEIFKDEAVFEMQKRPVYPKKPVKKTEWSADDHKSPLEETMTTSAQHKNLAALPSKKEDEFGQVLRCLKFPVPDEAQARLRSLVISRAKEIRNDDQVIGYAMRKAETGGLEMNEQQARELLSAIHQVMEKQEDKAFESLPEKKHSVVNVGGLPVPAETKKKSIIQGQPTPGKPKVHDVVLPAVARTEEKKKSVGPVDELRTMGLIDFRRLGADPMKASDVLKEKFEVLKKESYLFFLEAMKAWHESPLYKQYQDVICQAIEQGKRIDEILLGQNDSGQLRKTEFDALVKLSMNLH